MEGLQKWIWRFKILNFGMDIHIHCPTSRQQVDLHIELKYGGGSERTYNYKYFVVDGPKDCMLDVYNLVLALTPWHITNG